MIRDSMLVAIKDHVIITDMKFDDQKTEVGIIIKSDDGKIEGIRPRWARIISVGPQQRHVRVGEWVLIEHGRWTRGYTVLDSADREITVRRVDVAAMMAVSDTPPNDIQFGEHKSPDTSYSFDFSEPMVGN